MPSPNIPEFGIERLREEGYDLSIVGGELIVRGVPFVDERRRVLVGALAVPLAMVAGRLTAPVRHYSGFQGGTPCDVEGRRLPFVDKLSPMELAARGWNSGLCLVPVGREFEDYHELVVAYVAAITGEAQRIDPNASVYGNAVLVGDEVGPFEYADVASVRAGTTALTAKLASAGPIGIVGLGGTGSYVLDLVAKTPVPAIHLFDGDEFLQHNAFRAPGAATIDDLHARRSKVDHFAAVYSAMHRGIVPHRRFVDVGSLPLLRTCGFVFVCVDEAAARQEVLDLLASVGTPAVDVGMGLRIEPDGIAGLVRVGDGTSGGAAERATVDDARDPYRANVQIAELNALNASLAVIAWKRRLGFYAGAGFAHSAYVIEASSILGTP